MAFEGVIPQEPLREINIQGCKDKEKVKVEAKANDKSRAEKAEGAEKVEELFSYSLKKSELCIFLFRFG